MKAFADLYAALDESNKTNDKVAALTRYFRRAAPADAIWGAYFLIGRRLRQVVPTKKLVAWAAEEASVSDWLFGESYDAVGDLAETIALLLPDPIRADDRPLHEWVDRLEGLRGAEESEQRSVVLEAWRSMGRHERFAWNKLLSGGFRVGVSQALVVRALAAASGVPAAVISHRMMGDWPPTPETYARIVAAEDRETDRSRPYPFCLAHPLEGDPAALGDVADWQVEWKWDGIRAQLIRRKAQTYLWTRGEELVTDRYPEIAEIGGRLADGTVLDGEILPWLDGAVLPFSQLQRRIGRKSLGKKILAEVPVVLVVFDVLESDRIDLRAVPLRERRERLESIVRTVAMPKRLIVSPLVKVADWDELAETRTTSRERQAEGLMLKRLESTYHVGRVRGDWWKWKIEPYTVDAVLTAAQRWNGKRASLYTDYTFSVWDGDRLVPIAKAYSGLDDAEIREVDAWIRKHMVEAFGPVRTVTPELVFELAFEAIGRSTRHRSGVAVRFPRILRRRTDKKPEDADSIDSLRAMLPPDRGEPVTPEPQNLLFE